MRTWTENLEETVDVFLNGLVELHREHDPDSEFYTSLANSYKKEIHRLYREDLAVANLLDTSQLVAHYSGETELSPTFSLMSGLCENLHGAIKSIAESFFQLRSASTEKVKWPEELTPQLSGMVPGSLVLGVRIGAEEATQPDMFADELRLMVEDVESALNGVAGISEHLQGGAVSQRFKDEFQDPATRDIILAAAVRLAPTSQGPIQQVVFQRRDENARSRTPLTKGSRSVLRRELDRPEKTAIAGMFSGMVRAIDLDSNRFTLRRVSEWGSIRCIYRPTSQRELEKLRHILNATVSVSGMYETAPGKDEPRLMHVQNIEVITPAAQQNELEL